MVSYEDVLENLIRNAQRAGADAADAVMTEGSFVSVACRNGKLEKMERADSANVGLRVFVGRKVAVVSASGTSAETLESLPGKAVHIAQLAPDDAFACLPPKSRLAKIVPDLDLEDPLTPSTDDLVDLARRAENAALAVPGVRNSEGTSAGAGQATMYLATSDGFCKSRVSTMRNVGAAVIAGQGTGMECGSDQSSARHMFDLESPETIGQRAGESAAAQVGPRSVKSQKLPVIFDTRVSGSLLNHFVGAINGAAIARGVSFLRDLMHKRVFSPSVTVVDDPHRKRGLRSAPFDGEGVANRRTALVEKGELTTWLLDSASALKLGLSTTGHAARGAGGAPHPGATNCYMLPGECSPQELMADIRSGIFVTNLIGVGVNGVTGDYSRGASGFWIENGAVAHPISGFTLAGNLKDMFLDLTPANDLAFRYGLDAPTLRVEQMTVAGL